MIDQKSVRIVQDRDKAISVLHEVGEWMEESGKNPSKWWQPANMNAMFFKDYAEPDEFYVALIHDIPAAAMVLQDNERNQSWESIDKDKKVKALYIHWLCVTRKFSGIGLPKKLIDFAAEKAGKNGIHLLRVDTNAQEEKLRSIYEELGFRLMGTNNEEYRQTAFYQKNL